MGTIDGPGRRMSPELAPSTPEKEAIVKGKGTLNGRGVSMVSSSSSDIGGVAIASLSSPVRSADFSGKSTRLDQREVALATAPQSKRDYLRSSKEYMRQKQIQIYSEVSGLSDSATCAAPGDDKLARLGKKYFKQIKEAGNRQLPEYRSLKARAMPFRRHDASAREALGAMKEIKRPDISSKQLTLESLDTFLTNAKLSRLSYNGLTAPVKPGKTRELPAGYVLADDRDMPTELRFFYNDQSGLLNLPNGTRALLVKKDDGSTLTVAFAGTDFKPKGKSGRTGSMKADALQFSGTYSSEYGSAVGLAKRLLDHPEYPERRLEVTGHSLGGAMVQFAIAANIDGNQERLQGYGYNPAGLKLPSLEALGADNIRMSKGKFIAVRVKDDPVSASGDIKLAEKIKGRSLGETITLMPDPNKRHVPLVGTHGMDAVINALEATKAARVSSDESA